MSYYKETRQPLSVERSYEGMADGRQAFKRLNFSGVVPGSLLQLIALDLVGPYMVYQFLTSRMSWLPALLVVTLFPLIGIVTTFIRQRLLDLFAVASLYIIAFIMINTLTTLPDTALHLTIPVGIAGLIVLATQWLSRPLLFSIDRYYHAIQAPEQASTYDRYWLENTEYRRTMKVMNQVCGWGQICLALLLSIIAYVNHSQSMYLLLLPFIIVVFYIVFIVWSLQYRTMHEQGWEQTHEDAADLSEIQRDNW
jgi:hypothetical protein